MGARSLSNLAAIAFLVLGVLAIGLRFRSREAIQEAETDSRWRVTYNYELEPSGDLTGEALVCIGLPLETPFAKIVTQEFTHPDLKAKRADPLASGTRELRAVAMHGGKYPLTAEFEIELSPKTGGWSPSMPKELLTTNRRVLYLKDEDMLPKSSPTVQREIRKIPRNVTTESEKLQWLFEVCSRDLRGISGADDPLADEVPQVLHESKRAATPLGRARTFVTLCRAAGIPARLVTGFELRQARDAQPHVWTEVYTGKRWVPFDPEFGYARRMPINFFPVRRGGAPQVWRIPANSAMQGVLARYAIERMGPPESLLHSEIPHPVQILDLTRLPLEMHQAMSLILLLPFGAVITAVFRNIIGLKTFGTFAPALLAMSFIYADWGTGILILAVVLTAGFTSRRWLERLRLLMVPRLSIVLTTIILFIMFGVSLLDYLNLTPSAQAVLLPMVILTTLTERFFVTSEEDGPAFAMKLALGTLVVASICYAILAWDAVGQWILAYPEAHFVTIAVLMYIGRYTGYRLSELVRFRDFVKGQEG
ncbi:MAG: hypothetical protein KF688_05540 [Pirellulales bacterium]|nr:hypothetical protein [Pirellulales bacterium]MBX3432625.1 hypothetical protein [Pirellulales bacterium]